MTFQFKIQLKNLSNPTVWRRVLVSESSTLDDLHQIIQGVFPWFNCQWYQFSPSGNGSYPIISTPNDENLNLTEYVASETKLNEVFTCQSNNISYFCNYSETKLNEVFTTEKQTFTYIYDFVDDWVHKITLEKILPETVTKPICIKGKGKCPPENCGGVWGYETLLEVLAQAKHKEYKEARKWLGLEKGEIWDVNEFDLEEVNEWLESEF